MMEILYSMSISLGGFCKIYDRREVEQWKF